MAFRRDVLRDARELAMQIVQPARLDAVARVERRVGEERDGQARDGGLGDAAAGMLESSTLIAITSRPE